MLETLACSTYAVACEVDEFYLTPLAGLSTVKSCRQHWRNNMRRIDGAAVCPARLNPNQSSAFNAGFPLVPGYSHVRIQSAGFARSGLPGGGSAR